MKCAASLLCEAREGLAVIMLAGSLSQSEGKQNLKEATGADAAPLQTSELSEYGGLL